MPKPAKRKHDWKHATLGIHGDGRKKHAHFAVSTPIVQTSNYYFENTSDVYEFMKAKQEGRTIREHEYGRYGNPTQQECERKLAAVEGAFNAVMLQGDAIREITLEGPGAGGIETASAVVADLVSIIGTTGTGFLHNDPCWRTLERMPPGDLRSPFYVHLEVDDRPGVLADVSQRLAAHEVSVARLTQVPASEGAALHVVLHEARERDVEAALGEIAALPQIHAAPSVLPVISDRGVVELGWA